MIKTLSIDPGMGGIGYALWEDWGCGTGVDLLQSGCLRPKRKQDDWQEGFKRGCVLFSDLLNEHDPALVLIERPMYVQNAVGHAVAASGDLIKLGLVAGALAGIVVERAARLVWVEVRDWKGQVSKKVSTRRVSRCLTARFPEFTQPTSEHAVDAVGIGLFHFGLLKP